MSLATLRAVRRNPPVWFAQQAERGGVQHVRIGPTPAVLLSDPELVQQVFSRHADALDKSTRGNRILRATLGHSVITALGGEDWRERRRRAQPFFGRRAVEAAIPTVVEVAQRHAQLHDGRFDLLKRFSRSTVELTGRLFFDDDLARHQATIEHAVEQVTAVYGPLNQSPLPRPELSWTRDARALRTSRRALVDVARDVLARSRGEGVYLGVLPEDDGIDELITLLLAGSETVGVAATWAVVLLTQHPEARHRMREELEGVDLTQALGDPAALPFSRACVLEALRLRPPAWLVARRLRETIEIQGHVLPEGHVLFVPLEGIHRSVQWWSDPMAFRPERWIEQPRPPAFFAFGEGPRRCIGASLAVLEELALLGAHLQRGDLVATTDTCSISQGLSTRPLFPVWARLFPDKSES